LDADLIAAIPKEVPGPLPKDALDYVNLLIRETPRRSKLKNTPT
jgi:hypothetical protein